jgi:hypothetical protein
VQNELQRAWKEAGFVKGPEIVALTLAYEPLSLDRILFASAGGARYKGARMGGAFFAKGHLTPDEKTQRRGLGPPEKRFGLRDFINSLCIAIEGALVSRRVLIKYVSNKLGGAHFDPRRDHSEEGKVFRRLDSVGATIRVIGKQDVYYELLSIGQALAQADDIRKFCERARPNSV